jgi:alanine dehydrogenase
MRIGIPRETKDHEYRVALTPEGARRLVEAGHAVSLEAGAGAAVGYADTAYRAAGASLVDADGA